MAVHNRTFTFRPVHRLTWRPWQKIRWKIVLPYLVLTIVLAVAGSYLATRLVTGSLEERFDNQLAEAGRVVSDSVVRKEREHLEVVRAVTFTEGVAEAIDKRDARRISELVTPIAVNARVERLEVLDSEGARLKTLALVDPESLAYEEMTSTDDPTEWAVVRALIEGRSDELGDKFGAITETSVGSVLYSGGPVSIDGRRVGIVLVGTTLDSLVRQMKNQSLADITVYNLSGAPLVSTFARPDDAATDEADLSMSPAVLAGASSENETVIREHKALWGRGYDLVYGQLKVRGEANALYSVGLPTSFISNAATDTRTQIAFLFGLGMAASLGIGLLLSHLLTNPIQKLLRTTRRVAEGDLTARSGVQSSDEIGALAASFDEMTERLQHQHLATISALTSAIDARDPSTLGHSVRVGQLSVMIGTRLGLDATTKSFLEIGGYLHDIGKIGIRDAILLKPGKLTPEERHIIEEHPRIGMDILKSVELSPAVREFVESHHERLDGSGYPYGLSGEAVPIVARIGAVADMYDALTSERPYRRPDTPVEALGRLRLDSQALLDPLVVEALASILPDWQERLASEPALRGFELPSYEGETVKI